MNQILIIPSIDIKNGKTVRVVQGIPDLKCEEYGNDAVEMARIWRAENAKLLHVVDFDAIQNHSSENFEIINQICKSVILPVELAGGVRTMDDVEKVFDIGICRLIISTMAVENQSIFSQVFEKYGPSKIAVALDIVDNEIVIRGRTKKTGIFYNQFITDMVSVGVDRFIVTDVTRNGTLTGPNINLTRKVAELSKSKVTHSGGIRNKDELLDLQELLHLGVDSVIIGRALYENRFPCQKLWRLAESGMFN